MAAMAPSSTVQRVPPLPLWTRDDVARRVLDGEVLFIRNGLVVRAPPGWLERHPGGDLAILHCVGKDATNETDAFHGPHILPMLDRYAVARVELDDDEGWRPLVPPISSGWVRRHGRWHRVATAKREGTGILLFSDADTSAQEAPTREDLEPAPSTLDARAQRRHMLAYQELHKRVYDAGLYQTGYITRYGPEVVRYVLLAVLSALCYRHGWFLTSALFLGLFWHQLTLCAHDFGHLAVTHAWSVDRAIGVFIANVLGGLSISWWVNNHNIHHLITNHPSHDPDIEHMPFFAITTHFLRNLHSTFYSWNMRFDAASKTLLAVQHRLFYIVMALARFNLYALSYHYLWRVRPALTGPRDANAKRRAIIWLTEVSCICVYWYWYGRVLVGTGSWKTGTLYALVSHVAESPLHLQINIAHFSRPTDDLGPLESFPHRQLRTTVDIKCPPYLAFTHGGLFLQVTHHFFPRLPRHNLRAASKLVKEFAREQGLEYAEFGTFAEGNLSVLNVLADVARHVTLVRKVAQSEVDEALAKVRAVTVGSPCLKGHSHPLFATNGAAVRTPLASGLPLVASQIATSTT